MSTPNNPVSCTLTISGHVVFDGYVIGADILDDRRRAIVDSIFYSLHKNMDCSNLVIDGVTWQQYIERRYTKPTELV